MTNQLAQRGGLLLLLCLSLPGCGAKKSDAIQWGADREGGAPYIYVNPKNTNEVLGFEVDIRDALQREIGRPIEFHQYDFGSLEPGVLRGDFDFAMNGLEVTPERKQSLRFSRPYYIYEQQLVVRADDKRFTTLDDIKKFPEAEVGTLAATAAERLLQQHGIRVRTYEGQVEPYVDLERGQIDAVLLDYPIAIYYAQANEKLKLVGEPSDPGQYAIAFRPDNKELADEIDGALGRIIASGEMKRILEKWRIWTPRQEELETFQPKDVLAESRREFTFSVYIADLLQGAKLTIQVSILSMLLAVGLGLPIAVMRLYGPLPLRWLAVGYVEFFRGIPVLLLLFFLYFGLPTVLQTMGLPRVDLSPFAAAVIGFGMNYAAFEAEIYRAGISAIPAGQWEAAASLGMPGPLTFRRIILPQALRTIIPPMTNDFVALFKDTSIISTIGLVELTKQYQILSKSSTKYAEIGLVAASLYLIMSVPLGYLSRYLEKKWSEQ